MKQYQLDIRSVGTPCYVSASTLGMPPDRVVKRLHAQNPTR